MATSGRVKEDDPGIVEWIGKGSHAYVVRKVGKRFRLYEDGSYYSQTSGGVSACGKAVRRYDLDAGDQEGKFASFDTAQEAVAYAERWLIR